MLAGPLVHGDAIKNIDEMLKLDADYALSQSSPYPNTDSLMKVRTCQRDCWDQHGRSSLWCRSTCNWTEHLTKEEILDLLKIAHRKFYFRPKFLARQVMNLKTPTEFKRLASGALNLVKMELLSTKSHEAPV